MFLTEEGQIQSNEPVSYQIVNKKHKIKDPNEHKNKKRRRKKHKHPIIIGFFKMIVVLILLIILFALMISGYAIYKLYEVAKDVRLDKNDLIIKYENSVIKDIKGNELGTLNGDENRVIITLDDMPKYLPVAFISIEDERFYQHEGVDIKRTLRATYTYIKNKGQSPFGGSTITQQLIKNLKEEREDTWQRKVREMLGAFYAEQEMSKEEILELYLNLIFLGDTVYGVEQGANYYFNKSAKDLSLAESAFLAGINHSPNSYNPFDENNAKILENIKLRTKTVLRKMYELGNIEAKQYNKAVKEVEEGLAFEEGAKTQVVFSYHTDAAINQIIKKLQEKNNWSYEKAKLYLSSGGFTIYTTQDPDMQNKMQEEFNNEKYHTVDIDPNGVPQDSMASMVLMDHKTGYVLAIANGFDEKVDAFGFNVATDGEKQTGSSMKTIAVLAPAIDRGIITASTIFDDNPTSFNNGTYNPKNFNRYRGLITVRDAIAYSQNIPMVKTMTLLTPEESVNFLKKSGITSLKERDKVLPLALGGLTWGVTPLEMAGAYAAIANDGEYIEPIFFTKVVDSKGNTVLEANPTRTRIMSKEAAYVVKEILTEPVKKGTATNCKIEGIDVAAKTGTTDLDYNRWTCGFTPYYTAVVWFGHNTDATISGWPSNPTNQIWIGVMQKIHEGMETKRFYDTKPEGVLEVEVCKKSGFLATSTCERYRTSYVEYFAQGTEPVQTCPYHSSAKVCVQSGLLATENCSNTRRVYATGEYINGDGLWSTRGYYKPKNVPVYRCNIH